ncbi:MAG: hypothetical protein ABSC18_13600 [Verrucomicrobiota bacterium]
MRQGHYALNPNLAAARPAPNVTLERIGDLLDYNLSALLAAAHPARP